MRLILLLATIACVCISTGGAQTFDRDMRLPGTPANTRQAAPQVRIGPNGIVYMAWTDFRVDAGGHIYLATSNDGGVTFDTGRAIINGSRIEAGMQRGAQFVVDAGGNIHMVWQELNVRNKVSARYARSTDGGATFSAPLAIAADGGRQNQDFPSVAVDSVGNVYVAWIDDRESAGTQLYFTRSLDNGATFSTPVRAGTMPDGGNSCECCNTSIAASANGGVFISFRSDIANKRDIWIARSFDSGATFTLHQAASENWTINACPMTGSSIIVDRDETAHVVWRDSRPSSGGIDYIYYTSLRKNESACPPDRRISGTTARSNFPSLGISPDGTLFCAFQDTRNDASDVFYVTSLDGGFTFSTARKLTHETGTSKQEVPSVAIAPSGRVIVAWQDNQNDEGDVLYSVSSTVSAVSDEQPAARGVMTLY